MKCIQCKQEKLAKEFPPSTITERLKALKLEWDKAPFKIGVNSIGKIQPIISDYGNIATGEFHVKLHVNQTKQKLIYNGEELQDTFERRPRTLADYKIGPGCHIQLIVAHYNRCCNLKDTFERRPRTLADYKIGPGCHIQLIVAHYNRCCNLKVCIFDLHWTYPANGPQDFLDGSCLLYAGDTFLRKYDSASVYYPSFPHMKHSGEIIDNAKKEGHQRITAKLDQFPQEVTQLYFVLSSRKSLSIGHFRALGFKLYDEAQLDKELCTYTIQQASNSQAVILCCVSRTGEGMWQVIQVGKLSSGNANDYDPIKISIDECELHGYYNPKVFVFDLHWTYPANGPQDFLDGSCLLYAGDTFLRKYDSASVYYPSFPHMKHSGEIIDNAKKEGHQRITAKLDQLPQEVTQLYFVLSSRKSLSIGHFRALSFKLYDEAQPDKELCTYTIQQAPNSQAVILSCISRTGEGMWQVIQVGKLSSGNVNDYDPIKISIDECKLHGYIG
ncbi:hypothetical protein Glove_177g11 [Diversispora epigaea]|uniref:Ubiquitin-like domain-containing protein n=1 Tax=Diversispora epigaea TaxID=1348612 RepID=A0A397IRE7_9GLOM|nr:hypothetical protein Glove_177g11 [Diversispora epigaea]